MNTIHGLALTPPFKESFNEKSIWGLRHSRAFLRVCKKITMSQIYQYLSEMF
jgi:hypothetical protein